MKISASLYSRNDRPVQLSALHLDRFAVDAFHIDSRDELEVFDDIQSIRAVSATPVDLHIISAAPEAYFDGLIEKNIEYAAFQFEDMERRPQFPSELVERTQLGLSLCIDTPIEVFDEYRSDCSFIMLMTTVPGQSGGQFDSRALAKIDEVRRRYPMVSVHVDGGVNQVSSERLRQLDVEWAVSGSYLLLADSTPEALLRLRTRLSSGEAPIGHFMRKVNELPRLPLKDAENPVKILETIDSRPLGFCLVIDEDDHVQAVVSDGDVRRALLRSIEEGSPLASEWLLNRRPLMVNQNTTINELFQLVETHLKPFGFVPVNDNDGKLVGCVSLVELMRGVA